MLVSLMSGSALCSLHTTLTLLVHFELEEASGKSNFKYIFTKNTYTVGKLKRKFSVYEQ